MTDIAAYDPSADWFAEVPRSIRRHAITGLSLMVLAFGGFGYWAFTAPLASAVIAPGSFVATGRNKVVQHLEGGIIDEIFVAEGMRIREGARLLSLDETSAGATERELALREARLRATAERLRAEYNEDDRLLFPVQLLEMGHADTEVASILDSQTLTFDITRKSLMGDIGMLERNVEALRIREGGYSAQLVALESRSEILQEELTTKLELLESGLIRRPEVNTLRRLQAEAEGQLARLRAEVDETQQMIFKHEDEIARARQAYRETALDELGPIEADLESVREQARRARGILDRSILKSPVSGTVVRLHYHTVGGVIEPGKPVIEILPTDAPLIIETQIARTEIDSVAMGQEATVRLSALNRRTTPVLMGEVIYISADALREEVAGSMQEVYIARVSIPQTELDRVPGLIATPGMPVEVMIQIRERSFANYLTKPITDSFSRAFREQ
ncbi:Type I secretion system membrane fusion protein PrsE [Jannaschia seosinensis]|uniref:Membrane fusion protein (MFP) family protein n=1 Tax=Jannaschia seosinensis TaxID=313367 RepID=A0A0M7BBG6_9RHOB|nr:HlyD family type I secretion periplasmic adaptor subunit [Jannaschia seosinensis]CUH40070.1 Type I secretion system membrane fusion protein PrsE [Jannaschia seosinensis]